MNFQKFKESPNAFKLLVIAVLLITVYLIFSFYQSLQYSRSTVQSLSQLLIWLSLAVGFYFLKKWAWAGLFILISFSLLSIVLALISLQMHFNIYSVVSIILCFLIIYSLNLKSIRLLFLVDERDGITYPAGVTNFTILCFIVALFIFVDIVGTYNIVNSAPTRFFVILLGFTYAALGLGMWKLNKYTLQAASPLLIFIAIAVILILTYDYFKADRFLALGKSIYYILISLSILFYWLKFVKPKIQTEEVLI